jgi:hypothetical protein
MKTSFKIFCTIILSIFISLSGFSQECNASLFLKEGSVLEYTSFTKKGKEDGKTIHETTSVKDEDGKFTADIKSTVIDQKGKEAITVNYQAMCENGLFSVDMSRFFNSAQLQQYGSEDFKVEMDGNVLEFPANMTSDDALNDGNFKVRVNQGDFTLITMTFDITNRKVVGNESITTKAGTFDCQKVTYDFNSKAGIIKFRGSGVEWYLKDKVIVKSESYNKNGKLMAYSELTDMK